MRADIVYLRRMRFDEKPFIRVLPSFLGHDRPLADLRAGDDEWIGNRCPLETLLLANQRLKMLDPKNRGDKPQLIRVWRREQ